MQTDRGELLYRGASRPPRRRADLADPGRVGVRLFPAQDRAAVAPRGRGPAAARSHLRAARGQLLRLWIAADVEGAWSRRRVRRARAGVAWIPSRLSGEQSDEARRARVRVADRRARVVDDV